MRVAYLRRQPEKTDEFELTVSRQTGSKTRKQYHLAEISNGAYAVQVQVRDWDAENYFRR